MMTEQTRQSQLVAVLREGVAIVQMIFFKELRTALHERYYGDMDKMDISRLAGAVTNELFGTPNPEPEFVQFQQEHRATIEQEMLRLATELPQLRRYVTDALRIQALCDSQEGVESDDTLLIADKLGILLRDREIPLPSVFMTMVREVGKEHELIIPPTPTISAEDDTNLTH